MKRELLLLLAATTLASATPMVAAAQPAPSINQRQAELEAGIAAGMREDSLTRAEAAQIRADFDALARLEGQYRASGGVLTPAERSDLDRRFDELARRLHASRNDADRVANDPASQTIRERERTLEAGIAAGVRNDSLTNAEAISLRAELADIARQEAQYRASGRELSPAERAELNRRLDALGARIRANRNDAERADNDWNSQNINERQQAIEGWIDAGIRNGTVSAGEAAQLRAEFDAIARMERQYRASPPGLTAAERADLNRRFDMLRVRVQQDRNDVDQRWTNLDRRQAQFEERLQRAINERRISAREAAALRAEFIDVARLERQYRDSPPGITPQERADLNARFDRMQATFRATINGGRYREGPNTYDTLFEFLIGLRN